MNAVRIEQVKSVELHEVWPFVRAGIERIVKKVKPDFLPEDVYSAVRGGYAQLYVVGEQPPLGFFVNYVERRPFSNKPQLFLWCAYSRPLRERSIPDETPAAISQCLAFMRNQAKAAGGDIVFLSTRRGFKKFGFKQSFTTWVIPAA